jgi:hypothetical protein
MRAPLTVLLLVVLAVVAFAAAPNERPKRAVSDGDSETASVETYGAQQATPKLRVTLLGITKGVAFLESQELAVDGGRKHGNNVIPWLRVAVLTERLNDQAKPLGPVGIEIRTPEGREMVEPLKVQHSVDGQLVAVKSRASGVAQMQLDFEHLAQTLFPTAPPKVEKPEQSFVLVFTISGRVRDAAKIELIMRFGDATESEEVVFTDVPVP